MRDSVTIIRERQLAIRREMDRRGLALKQVEFDAGIPYATLLSYFPAEGSRDPAVIPASAIYKLAEGKALPNDLLSLLLPNGYAIVQVPEGINHDELADAFADYLHAKNAAHHPDSPAGRDIADCERDALNSKVVVMLPLKGVVNG
jgi:hypothetical protein